MFAAMLYFDYVNISSDMTFASGSTDRDVRCANISILDDFSLEGDQTFTVMLDTSDPDVLIGNDRTTITIIYNDG